MFQFRHTEWEIHLDATVSQDGIHKRRIEGVKLHDMILILFGARWWEEILGSVYKLLVVLGSLWGGITCLTVEHRETLLGGLACEERTSNKLNP